MSTKNWIGSYGEPFIPSTQEIEVKLSDLIAIEHADDYARLSRKELSVMLSELFGRVERLERLARHHRQGLPLGEVPYSDYPED